MKPETARKILTRWWHWTITEPDLPPEPKHITLGVPHSTIRDFVVAWLYYRSIGGEPRVMVKKDLFFWPLGPVLRRMGAIPVDRRNPVSITRQVIDAMAASETFHLCIAPEGTRKPVKRWKTGFVLRNKEEFMEILASLGSLAMGVIILYIIVKLLSLPFKLVWNGIIGAIMLWLANLLGGALFGVSVKITIIKALIAGFFGIPGAAAVILWDLFVK